MRKLLVLLFVLVLAGAGGLAACSSTHVEAGMVLGDLAAGQGASTFKRVTPRPERQHVVWTAGGKRHEGDLYLPAEKAKAAMVVVPGAAREGAAHPALVALAQTLARARIIVLVPDIPAMRALEISSDDRLPIAEAARYLRDQRSQKGIGIAAISYAVIPAVLAALDEPSVDFVVGVGGAYDVNAVVTFFTTGHYREGPDGEWRRKEPNVYGKWVFVKSNARRMEDSADRALLSVIADRRMADPSAPVDDLTARLSPQGRAVMDLLANDDPGRVPALVAALPKGLRAEMARMDLSARDLSGLRATLFLIHGRDDRILPWTESQSLARAVPRAELTLLDNLAHAELKPGGIADTYALWRAVANLLARRDQLASGRS